MTVLRGRGFPPPDLDLLRDALGVVDDNIGEAISKAITNIEHGGGTDAEFETASLLGRCLNTKIKLGLMTAGINFSAGGVLQHCFLHADGFSKIKKAVNGDELSITEMVQLFGRIGSEPQEEFVDSLHDLEPPPEATAHAMPELGAKKKVKSEVKDPRLGSYIQPSELAAPQQTAVPSGNMNHHVYGKSGALTFEIDIARAAEGKSRQYTLRIEGARAKEPGVYLWSEKVIFQLTRKELHQAAAVFLGLSENAKFNAHGDSNEKWCELAVQSSGVYVKVGLATRVVAVPIGKEDLYEVALLAARALFLNDPDLDQGVVMDLLRLTSRVVAIRAA